MTIQMEVKPFLEIHYNGKKIDDSCPACGSTMYKGDHGIMWCENPLCTWSNDERTTTWLESRLQDK
jgi:hypothetical protein